MHINEYRRLIILVSKEGISLKMAACPNKEKTRKGRNQQTGSENEK